MLDYLSFYGSELPSSVTAEHLLDHTAGFDEIKPGTQADSRENVASLADFLRTRLVRIWPAGDITSYSTYGITLAGLLVEEVSGLSIWLQTLRCAVPDMTFVHISGSVSNHRRGVGCQLAPASVISAQWI